jgi:hypothetical protein
MTNDELELCDGPPLSKFEEQAVDIILMRLLAARIVADESPHIEEGGIELGRLQRFHLGIPH